MLERAANDKHGGARWLCACSCGRYTLTQGTNLRSGSTKSCGCLQSERSSENARNIHSLPEGVAAFRALFRRIQCDAKKRNHKWQLTEEQVHYLTRQPCYYCGIEPSQVCKHQSNNGNYTYNGIDRIDNKKGYIDNNVVPCCDTCNYAKRFMTQEEFRLWIAKVYEHFGKGIPRFP